MSRARYSEGAQVSSRRAVLSSQNKTIGSGGYGVVVSAVDVKKETKVAVKKVVSAFDDMLVAKRMIREIRLLRQFDHDNIIRIVDMLPPPSVDKFKDVYMVLDRMDTVRGGWPSDGGFFCRSDRRSASVAWLASMGPLGGWVAVARARGDEPRLLRRRWIA